MNLRVWFLIPFFVEVDCKGVFICFVASSLESRTTDPTLSIQSDTLLNWAFLENTVTITTTNKSELATSSWYISRRPCIYPYNSKKTEEKTVLISIPISSSLSWQTVPNLCWGSCCTSRCWRPKDSEMRVKLENINTAERLWITLMWKLWCHSGNQ